MSADGLVEAVWPAAPTGPAGPRPPRARQPGPGGPGSGPDSAPGRAATRCSPTGGTSPSWPSSPARRGGDRTPATPSVPGPPPRPRSRWCAGRCLPTSRTRSGRPRPGRPRRRRSRRYAGWRPRAALATGQVGDAAAYASDALRSDPYDEAALRTLMRAHVAAGRPASALAEFARVRELLGEELGVEPAPETRALHEALLRRGAGPGASGRDIGRPGRTCRGAAHPGRGAGERASRSAGGVGQRRARGRQDRAARPVGGRRNRARRRRAARPGRGGRALPCSRSSTRWPAGWPT